MKRSEVLSIITDILKENVYPKWFDVSHRNVAQEILSKLEEMGMKAPLNSTSYSEDTYEWEQE